MFNGTICVYRGGAVALAEWLYAMSFARVRVWYTNQATGAIEARALVDRFNQLSTGAGAGTHPSMGASAIGSQRAIQAPGGTEVSEWTDCLVVLRDTTVFGSVRRCVYWEPD